MTQSATSQQAYFQPMYWEGDHLRLLDQRRLPHHEEWLRLENVQQIGHAIRDLAVRGAPAIGITAAYGAVLAAQHCWHSLGTDRWHTEWLKQLDQLQQARPTAINLRWALQRMRKLSLSAQQPVTQLEQEALKIHKEDIACNQTTAKLGAELIESDSCVLTHCNTGPLATGAIGTALGVVIEAHQQGKLIQVYADETRPWLQGSRLTAWELAHHHVPCQVIVDGAAAWLMASQSVQWLIVGSDRIAANGDVANKIGTYAAMLAAKAHGVKTMVVVPWSTVDMETSSGADIPIEQRGANEIISIGGQLIAAEGTRVWNPVFDITPASLVDVLVTERGVIHAPDELKMRALA